MNDFMKDLEMYSSMENEYLKKFPQAQPIGNFYSYFGLSKMMEILEEANGREIRFYKGGNEDQCIYVFV
ncbi:hypothetical protein [Flexithrix dorotheae]|uniref:hypothetical protein n=1 Tax=Flexithrix dorotheae TaxID=70993 RepID=UPI00036662A4|nr:hypothetical protein [Flexithrix dorotheae]